MESRKDMVMFLDAGQLGTLVGKRVSNLSEAVGSPLPEPPEKMVPRGCLSPRAGPPAARERGGGGLEEEPLAGCKATVKPRPADSGCLGAAALRPVCTSVRGPNYLVTSRARWRQVGNGPNDLIAFGLRLHLKRQRPSSEALASSPNSGSEAPKSNSGGSSQGTLACSASDQIGPANGLAPRAAAASDFTCASTSRSDSFLTFAPSVLSKASSVALDQREEVPLTR
uniref:Uncharacterized protein n=1 Tax=Suricata suricatta TaxID=37032 RepID=A0A673VA98_SURSU